MLFVWVGGMKFLFHYLEQYMMAGYLLFLFNYPVFHCINPAKSGKFFIFIFILLLVLLLAFVAKGDMLMRTHPFSIHVFGYSTLLIA